ncbi:MAG: neutral/alkaline non-lysosomal ceramidase N-terminal domain-containing protein [Corynebacterium sp.]|uniref:neutral/alkaline non-lysosomal ceramidase N-terminal domain-containing protein n=1 Tax=Corynebacterium sp. TaxID=1720 RepID=UPI003F9A325C
MTDHHQSRQSPHFSRRTFLAALAAMGGTVLWSSRAGTPSARAGTAADSPAAGASSPGFSVGRGIADTTGEPLGAGMDGYAVQEQTTAGIRQRLYSRAFIFEDGDNRFCHVTVDTPLMFQSVFLEVVRRLREKYGETYSTDNVVLSATHTHVGPGGRSGHAMVDLVTLGFRPVTFEAQVTGIVRSIERAHADIAPSELSLVSTEIDGVGANRSHLAFEKNPQADRDANPGGIDRTSVTLHVSRGGEPVGLINWYSVHATSFSHEIKHISGDNKGFAAWSVEHAAGVDHLDLGAAPFIAAFSQGAPGDVTPNMGLEPESGPGGSGTSGQKRSVEILGSAQADGARPGAGTPIGTGGAAGRPGVEGRSRWVDMDRVQIDGAWTPDGAAGRTGPAVLGAAFAASSQEDGGGLDVDIGLNEGERGGAPWVRQLNEVAPIPEDVRRIHAPKNMLLPMGYVDGMIQQRHIFGVWRIGGLVIAHLGFEPTTTSGLRIRRTVAEAVGVPPENVVVQGYSCGYGHYIATPEEYTQQDYEGGATAFGRLTLPAVQQVFDGLGRALASGGSLGPGEKGGPAGDLTGIIPDSPAAIPVFDTAPPGKGFGDVVSVEPASREVASGGHVTVRFVGANPNNDLRLEEGYLRIEDGEGGVIAHDSSWETLLTFHRTFTETTAVVDWNTDGVEPGEYRVLLRGDWRDVGGAVKKFEGSVDIRVR